MSKIADLQMSEGNDDELPGGNNCILNEMKQEDFMSTKLVKNMQDMFLRNEPYKMFYKMSMDENAEFKTLNLLPRHGRPRQYYERPVYENIREISTAKYKNMIDLLRYTPSEHHDFFKSLPHTKNVDEQ